MASNQIKGSAPLLERLFDESKEPFLADITAEVVMNEAPNNLS